MADNIRATPRNPVLGLFSDITQGGLDYLRDPRFRQTMMQLPAPVRPFGMGAVALPGLFESTGFPKTVERAAYGEPLTNIGMANVPTLKPETADLLMNVAPFAPAALRGAAATGRFVAPKAGQLAEGYMQRMGMMPGVVPAEGGLPVGMGIKDVSESPFVVYRGGTKGKAIATEGLDPGSVQLGQGAYFGSSKGMAEEFAKYRPDGVVEAYHLNLKTPFDETAKITPSTEQMQLLRKNLLDIGVPKSYVDELDQPYRGAITNLSDAFSKKLTRQGQPTTNWQAADKINSAIRKSGFDGIIADVPEGGEQYVAFSKNQFKPLKAQRAPYPQQAALDLAQQRAALPVSEGGLGLTANNTAEQRASAMGFDTDAYHGTNISNITKFDLGKSSRGEGTSVALTPENAQAYGNITYPLKVNQQKIFDPTNKDQFNELKSYVENLIQKQKPYDKDSLSFYPFTSKKVLENLTNPQTGSYYLENELISKSLQDLGYSGSIGMESGQSQLKMFDPAQIRSRFAAFDPFRKTAAIAATMGVAAPDLLANELDYPSNPMYTDPLGYSIR